MTKPIPDKAEVALEYPDKLYIGTFERTSRFDAHLDETGISLSLHRTGAADVRKSVRMHFHYGLFADILHDLAVFRAAGRCGTPRCAAGRGKGPLSGAQSSTQRQRRHRPDDARGGGAPAARHGMRSDALRSGRKKRAVVRLRHRSVP
jgi:hypothetical protein